MNDPLEPSNTHSSDEFTRFSEVERAFERALEEKIFSGASLLIADPWSILFHKTWGYTRGVDGKPVCSSTLFDLASITKAIVTAALGMWAVSQGKFDLDDTVCRFFPSGVVPSDKKPISIRQLLNHCSGLPPYEAFYRELSGTGLLSRRAALLNSILKLPLLSLPGKSCHYSDPGFLLLGIILETLLGEPLDRLSHDLLFASMSIEELGFIRLGTFAELEENPPFPPLGKGGIQENSVSRGISPCHAFSASTASFAATEFCPWRNRLIEGEVHDENAWVLGGVAGHAGLFGTARGVHRLLSCLWRIYRGDDSQPIGSHVVRSFWEKQDIVPESTWALGFDTPSPENSSAGIHFSPRSVGHLGFTGTSFWMDLDRELIVVLLTNRVHPSRTNESIKAFRPFVHNLVMKACHAI